jgi:hypothetical protein
MRGRIGLTGKRDSLKLGAEGKGGRMLIGMLRCSTLVQDKVENPEYKGWKPFGSR